MMVFQSVEWFAEQMVKRLDEHQHKGGWRDCTFARLIQELEGHVEDLHYNLLEQGRGEFEVVRECADIANFAMMIADNFVEGTNDEEE